MLGLRGFTVRFRATAVALALTVVASGLNVERRAAQAGPDVGWLASVKEPGSGPESPAVQRAVSAPLGANAPAAAPPVDWPEPRSEVVTLGAAGRPAAGVLTLAGKGGRVRVDVLDRASTRGVASGLVFRLSPVDGAGGPVEVAIDYSGFARGHGGGYADRLAVVALPECALAAPRPAGCAAAGRKLPSRNDAASSRLVATVPAGGTGLFAVASEVSGEAGNFGASPLAVSDKWQVAPGTGEFSWTYDITVPQPPIGGAPSVALAYSSGGVDGLVSTRNTQGPPSGVGWSDFASAYIERRYAPCATTGDMCWTNHNATISLNGHASEMLATDTTYDHWRLKDHAGWTVDLEQGTYANGDSDREYWRVTTPDGTQYFFGRGNDPGSGRATNSAWTVPVFADNAGEPCRGAGGGVGVCNQAWRWNLDQVVDANGIASTYFYSTETNKYLSQGMLLADAPYVRSGYLARIEYGKPAATGTEVFPSGQVLVETQDRAAFGDVPTDLNCASGCVVTTPTYYSSRRYSAVRTEVRAGNRWRAVEQVNLYHRTLTNGDGHDKLYLDSISRVGLAGVEPGRLDQVLILPKVALTYTQLDNRVDVTAAGGRRMGHFRLAKVVDEFGATTAVTYGQKNPCADGYTGPWDTNARDCFPQKVGTRTRVFHKYLVTRVDQRDTLGGGLPPVVTTYTYEESPAWHHDDDEFVPLGDQSWSDWRGYGLTLVTEGVERTRVRLFRGMDGDRLASGRRSATVAPIPDTGFGSAAVPDAPWLAGATYMEAQIDAGNKPVIATLHEYQASHLGLAGSDPHDYVAWVGENRTTTNTATPTAGAFVQQRTTTTYNTRFQPETVYEEGRLDRTGDERCTRTAYAELGVIVVNPSGVTRLAGACSSTDVLSQTETAYDARGNATRQRMRIDGTRWVTTVETAYDAFGRAIRVIDAKGLVTETAHETTPNGGFPTTTTVTLRASGTTHTSSTQWLPEYGVPVKKTDPNGFATSYTYDPLGRTLTVRQPTEQSAPSDVYSWQFGYAVSADKSVPPIVRTRRLQSTEPLRYEDSWVVYDSMLRPRQRQAFSPVTGKAIVTGTSYDDRGLVFDRTEPQAVAGQPGLGLLSVDWENKTRTSYDALGRVARQGWYRGNAEQWATVTTYTHDTTQAQSPGGRMSRTVVDGLGRKTQTAEYDGSAWQAVTHEYDLADRLTSVVDPVGNRITYRYNLAGWRIAQDDPDAGGWSFGYDDAGNQTTVTDAKGGVTVTAYDPLGRPTERRGGSATGPVLARWEYDAAGEKGLLDRSIRVAGAGEWVVDVTGYDERRRPRGTQWTVPAGVPGLAGTYTVGYGYDRADHLTTIAYPPAGGLPAETVTTRYDALGLPVSLTGADEYVWTTTYDDRGRPSTMGLGPRPGGQPWLARSWTYDQDQRPDRMRSVASGSTVVDHEFGYDAVGTPTSRTTALGGQAWRECYGYDVRDRLTSAYTTTAGACDGTGKGTGPQPYDNTYTYTPDGNPKTRVENGATRTYAYPTGAGADRPHAPTGVGADRYAWDANGNLIARTVGGRAETLAWDADRTLASVTTPAGTTSYVYDADGNRALRTTPAGRTIYVAGHEITAGTTVTAVRSYGFGGETVATRTPSGVDYLVADQQGSVEATLPSGGTLEVTRTYTPHGEKRSGGEPDTDRGWLGQIEDDSTELSYLNARYDDPSIGQFVAPDPVYDEDEPQSLNPYAYALNNPVSFSDPAGTWVPIGNGGGPRVGYHARWSTATNTNNLARHLKVAHHSKAPLKMWERHVQRKVDKYNRSALHRMRVAHMKRMKDIAALKALARANPDPAFWKAVAKAGSGQALVLMGLRAVNPDPDFWRAVAKIGAKRMQEISKRAQKANAIASEHNFPGMAINDPGGGGSYPDERADGFPEEFVDEDMSEVLANLDESRGRRWRVFCFRVGVFIICLAGTPEPPEPPVFPPTPPIGGPPPPDDEDDKFQWEPNPIPIFE
jgi:RHS repeat-associated protein